MTVKKPVDWNQRFCPDATQVWTGTGYRMGTHEFRNPEDPKDRCWHCDRTQGGLERAAKRGV